MEIVVMVPNAVEFPHSGWLSTKIAGPQGGRTLVEVRGHSGHSSWLCALMTAPSECIQIQIDQWEREQVILLPGCYLVMEGTDKRGQRLLRWYKIAGPAPGPAPMIAFAANGHLIAEASHPQTISLLEAEGYSRTLANGDRWALITAPTGSIVAVEPFHHDPVYYHVTDRGPEFLGETDAVLSPEDW